MLIYGKKVDGAMKLFGTTNNVPSASDAQLKYKDTNGTELTLVAGDTYVNNDLHGITRKSDDKFMGVFIGDAEKAIIPKDWEPEEPPVFTVTWDGNTTGLDHVQIGEEGDEVDYYKISATLPEEVESFLGGSIEVTTPEDTVTEEIDETNYQDLSPDFDVVAITCGSAGSAYIVRSDIPAASLTIGIWFSKMSNGDGFNYVSKLMASE